MRKLTLILLLFPVFVFGQSRINVNQLPTTAGAYVAQWGDNDAGIDSAIAHAGVNGRVVFSPGKVYSQTHEHDPLSGQIWIGNGAILQRQTETVTTTTGTVNSTDNTVTVASVPASWHVNDYIQIFITQSSVGASALAQISSISGSTVTIHGTWGVGLYNSAATYASGASVWKVWNQINNANHYEFTLDNVTLDGNSSTSASNVYWGGNIGLYSQSPRSVISNCRFINMPSDAIQGHGLYVINCYGHNINNSFVHLSADFSAYPTRYPSVIAENKIIRANQVLSSSGSQHSEGVITESFTSGYVFIRNNWVDSSLNCFIGSIQMSTSSLSGASRFMHIDNNTVKDCAGIIAGFSADVTETIKPGQIIITGNIFDNDGTTTPFPSTLAAQWAYIDKIVWFNNLLSGGTTITIPAEVYSNDAITNVGATANIQTSATINIDGKITTGAGANIVRNVNDANTTAVINEKQGTGNILDLQFNSVSVAHFGSNGVLTTPDVVATTAVLTPSLQNTSSSNNATLNMNANGLVAQRNIADGNTALIVNQSNASSTGKILDFWFNGATVANVDKTGLGTFKGVTLPLGSELKVTEGSGGFAGQTTLVSGTKAITISGVTTSSRAIISRVSQGGTVTTTAGYYAVCTANTVTITALTSSNATNTSDTSVINYLIVN